MLVQVKIERRTAMDLNKEKKNPLSEKEKKLVQMIRNLNFGELRVIVTDGVPTRVEEIKRSIKL